MSTAAMSTAAVSTAAVSTEQKAVEHVVAIMPSPLISNVRKDSRLATTVPSHIMVAGATGEVGRSWRIFQLPEWSTSPLSSATQRLA